MFLCIHIFSMQAAEAPKPPYNLASPFLLAAIAFDNAELLDTALGLAGCLPDSISVVASYMRPILVDAAAEGSVRVVEALAPRIGRVSQCETREYNTALHYGAAAKKHALQISGILVAADKEGALREAKNKAGLTAYEIVQLSLARGKISLGDAAPLLVLTRPIDMPIPAARVERATWDAGIAVLQKNAWGSALIKQIEAERELS